MQTRWAAPPRSTGAAPLSAPAHPPTRSLRCSPRTGEVGVAAQPCVRSPIGLQPQRCINVGKRLPAPRTNDGRRLGPRGPATSRYLARETPSAPPDGKRVAVAEARAVDLGLDGLAHEGKGKLPLRKRARRKRGDRGR